MILWAPLEMRGADRVDWAIVDGARTERLLRMRDQSRRDSWTVDGNAYQSEREALDALSLTRARSR